MCPGIAGFCKICLCTVQLRAARFHCLPLNCIIPNRQHQCPRLLHRNTSCSRQLATGPAGNAAAASPEGIRRTSQLFTRLLSTVQFAAANGVNAAAASAAAWALSAQQAQPSTAAGRRSPPSPTSISFTPLSKQAAKVPSNRFALNPKPSCRRGVPAAAPCHCTVLCKPRSSRASGFRV